MRANFDISKPGREWIYNFWVKMQTFIRYVHCHMVSQHRNANGFCCTLRCANRKESQKLNFAKCQGRGHGGVIIFFSLFYVSCNFKRIFFQKIDEHFLVHWNIDRHFSMPKFYYIKIFAIFCDLHGHRQSQMLFYHLQYKFAKQICVQHI